MSFKNYIKRIAEPINQYCFDELPAIYAKKCSIEKNTDKIQTLLLGSSHLDCLFESGYIENAFNLGLKSCDLYYMYSLYKKYAPLAPRLKNVIVFYSPFHYGWDLSKSPNLYHYIIFFKKLFNINYRYKSDFVLKLKELREAKKINKIISTTDKKLLENIDGNLNGYHYYKSSDEDFIKTESIISTIKNCVRNSNNSKYLNYINELSKKYNHNLIFVFPPCHKKYRFLMPDKSILFRDIFDLKEKSEIKIIDLYEKDFKDESYHDCEHLRGGGLCINLRLNLNILLNDLWYKIIDFIKIAVVAKNFCI